MDKKQEKGLNVSVKSFITAIVVIFVLMVAAYILTLVIPGGEYVRFKDANGNTVSASVINCTIGAEKNIELLIRRPAAKRFYFMSQYNGECELSARETEDGYIVTIPEICAWSVGTVFCE